MSMPPESNTIESTFNYCKEGLRSKYQSFSDLCWNDFESSTFKINSKLKTKAAVSGNRIEIKSSKFSEQEIKLLFLHELMHILHCFCRIVSHFDYTEITSTGSMILHDDVRIPDVYFNAIHDILIDKQLRVAYPEFPASVWKSLGKSTGHYKNLDNKIQKDIQEYIVKSGIDQNLVDLIGHFKTVLTICKPRLIKLYAKSVY